MIMVTKQLDNFERFCYYLFASQSLDMQHFNKSIKRIVNRNSRSKILFIYQNADNDIREQVTGNYKKFISNGFKSMHTCQT